MNGAQKRKKKNNKKYISRKEINKTNRK